MTNFKENGTKNIIHIWSLLCSSSVVDQRTNNLSINNQIDSISINFSKEDLEKHEKEKSNGFNIPVSFQLVSLFRKRKKESNIPFEVRLDLKNPDGVLLSSSPIQKYGIGKEIRNLRIMTNIPSLLIQKDKPGTYVISVNAREIEEGDFSHVGEVLIDVAIGKGKMKKVKGI